MLSTPTGGDLRTLAGESHLLTIGATSSEKRGSSIIPTLLSYPGPVVVIDPTGESYQVTARARREMGHTVVRLDPFHVIDQDSDALNPLDLISLDSSDVETDAPVVADLLWPTLSLNDFWERQAFDLVRAVIAYLSVVPEKRTVEGLTGTLTSDDVIYNLAVVLDTIGKKIPQSAYTTIASFLQKPDLDRARILAVAVPRLRVLMSKEVLKTLGPSSVPLTELIAGNRLSIFVIVPPTRLASHSALLRLWLGTLIHCVTSRKTLPPQRTLFILDECVHLENLSPLELAITSCRGVGLQVWTFWQDLGQIRGWYPATWPTMIENCGAIQVFGSKDYSAASEVAALFGIEPEDILLLDSDEQIINLKGSLQKVKTINYLTDPLLVGKFDPLPSHAPIA
jgi:type IV secretion system protein VirD4